MSYRNLLTPPSRKCGGCALCCKLLPVPPLGKPRSAWCWHAAPRRPDGCCTIYESRPTACALWSCSWLQQAELPEALRPDRCHVVIDPTPDTITQDDGAGRRIVFPCIQMWCDPDYPDAHENPALRRVMYDVAQHQELATIVRIHLRGIAIFAPPLSGDKQWHVIESRLNTAGCKDALGVAELLKLREEGKVP